MSSLAVGSFNSGIGASCGTALIEGYNNTFLGANTSTTLSYLKNSTAVGYGNKQNTEVSARLWSIWRTIHSHYSLPQEIELITVNHLINGRMLEFHFRVLTSYEQLVQEPLILFALPFSVLSEMFILRLVFINRAALCDYR